MAVKAHDLDRDGNKLPPPPSYSPIARLIALAVVGLLLVLTIRAIPSAFAPSQTAAQPAAPATVEALVPLRLAVTPVAEPMLTPTVAPAAVVAALLDPPAEPLPAGCPDAEVLPDGTRAGWIAKAVGCPGVLYASVGGVRRWVRRPANFPETLYEQLPELPAR